MQVRKIIKLLLLFLFVISLGKILYVQSQNIKAKYVYEYANNVSNETIEMISEIAAVTMPVETEGESMAETIHPSVWQEAEIEEDPFIAELLRKNLDALQEINADVLGWIEIPGTQLAYPIMDGDDNDYYLNHTWDKKSSDAGSIFLEQLNHSDMRDFNTFLYGHRMKNGSMFGSLKYYNTKEYYEEHPYVYILDEMGAHRYEIFAAYTAPVEGSTFLYGFHSEKGMQSFIEYCISKSEIDTGVIPTLDDKILTLVTCTGNGYEARWVVQARLKGVEGNPKRYYEETA